MFEYTSLASISPEIRLLRLPNREPNEGPKGSTWQALQHIPSSEGYVRSGHRGSWARAIAASLKEPAQYDWDVPDFELQTFPLQDLPPYTALSYVWGSPERTAIVKCNGQNLAITQNLKTAIRYAQISGGWIWADGICINQDDIPERNSQVRLMGDIYSKAENVIAFLGGAPGNTGSVAFVSLVALYNNLKQLAQTNTMSIDKYQDTSSMGIHCLYTLLQNPWFTRAWTIQEAVLNQNFSFWYGNATIPAGLISNLIEWSQRAGQMDTLGLTLTDTEATLLGATSTARPRSNTSVLQLVQMDAIARMRAYMERQGHVPFLRALFLGQQAKSADPRDKVYAFLGLLSPEISNAVHPDYSPTNTVDNVLVSFAQHCATTNAAVHMLRCAGYNRISLPSWVPDWTIFVGSAPAFSYTGYHSSGASVPRIFPQPTSPLTLCVEGVILDTLEKQLPGYSHFGRIANSIMGKVAPATVSDENVSDPFVTCLVAYRFLVEEIDKYYKNEKYPTGEDVLDATWRALIADHDGRTDARADPDCGLLSFQAFASCHQTDTLADPSVVDHLDAQIKEVLAEDYYVSLRDAQIKRRMGFTQQRFLALLPENAQATDKLAIISGAPMPFVLREQGGSKYILIGEAYIHGWMYGEMYGNESTKWENRTPEMNTIYLV